MKKVLAMLMAVVAGENGAAVLSGPAGKAEAQESICGRPAENGCAVLPRLLFHFSRLLIPVGTKKHPAKRRGVFGDPTGNRTRDTTVKGWCLDRLTIGPCKA